MNLYDVASYTNMEIDIPKIVMVAERECYIPVITYRDTVTGNSEMFLYCNSKMTIEHFEKDLARTYGNKAVIPQGRGEIIINDWCNVNVTNHLRYAEVGTALRDVGALYNGRQSTLEIGLIRDLVNQENQDTILIRTVYSRDNSCLDYNKKVRVLNMTDNGIDFRYAWNVELLCTTPTFYMLGVSMVLINGIKLEFMTPILNSKHAQELQQSIYSMYQLSDDCVASYRIVPIPVADISEDIEYINNLNRIDKYNIFFVNDSYIVVRSLKDVNPLYSRAKGLLDAQGETKLMPVYSF